MSTKESIRLEIIQTLLTVKSPATKQIDEFFAFAQRIENYIESGSDPSFTKPSGVEEKTDAT